MKLYPCGHPRTDANSYTGTCGKYCRTCDLERTRKYRERRPDYNKLYLRQWRLGQRRLPKDRLSRYWRAGL